MASLISVGDKGLLSPANMDFLGLYPGDHTSLSSFIVLSVDQAFFNGAPSGQLRIATQNTVDANMDRNLVLTIRPDQAKAALLVDEYGWMLVAFAYGK